VDTGRGFGVCIVTWRVRSSVMENVTGLLGLSLIVFAVSVFLLAPDWSALASGGSPAYTGHGSAATYWYFAISLFGAAMTRRLLCSWRWLLEHSVAARLIAA
jgi:Mn2+/Fe2+ NRAMP family transporter